MYAEEDTAGLPTRCVDPPDTVPYSKKAGIIRENDGKEGSIEGKRKISVDEERNTLTQSSLAEIQSCADPFVTCQRYRGKARERRKDKKDEARPVEMMTPAT